VEIRTVGNVIIDASNLPKLPRTPRLQRDGEHTNVSGKVALGDDGTEKIKEGLGIIYKDSVVQRRGCGLTERSACLCEGEEATTTLDLRGIEPPALTVARWF